MGERPHDAWADGRPSAFAREPVTRTVHRIDLPCEYTDFTRPPSDVHLKFLKPPAPGRDWTILAHAAPGRADALARWLETHPSIKQVTVAGGLAPRLLRARADAPPPAWRLASEHVQVHHLHLSSDGHAAWFVEGDQKRVRSLTQLLAIRRTATPRPEVRARRVDGDADTPTTSRRQFDALACAVANGYYEIPHRVGLRTLADQTGTSLGALSELLRRAESAVVTRYVDHQLMQWPREGHDDAASPESGDLANLLRRPGGRA